MSTPAGGALLSSSTGGIRAGLILSQDVWNTTTDRKRTTYRRRTGQDAPAHVDRLKGLGAGCQSRLTAVDDGAAEVAERDRHAVFPKLHSHHVTGRGIDSQVHRSATAA